MSTVQLKRSAVASKVPTTADLALGELAINTYDGLIYLKKDPGTPSIVTIATTDATQTLTNKTFTDASTTFQDDVDNTKKFQFQASGITTGTTRTITIPNATGTMSLIGLGETLTGAKVFRNAAGIKTEQAATQDAMIVVGRAGGTSSYTLTLTPTTLTSSKVVTFPDATGTVALTANKLSDFAATTSSELAGVISDETGSGNLVFSSAATLTGTVLNGNTNFSTNTLFVDSTNSRILVGSSVAYASRHTATNSGTAVVQINDTGANKFNALQWSASVNGSRMQLGHSRGATVGTHTSLIDGDSLGDYQFVGSDGAEFILGASIQAEVDGTVSSAYVPTAINFRNLSSSTTLASRMRIASNGNVGIATSSPIYPLHVNGSGYVSGNIVLGSGLSANGSFGTAGQVLTTNGTGLYWSTAAGGGGGATNLSLTANGSTVSINSDTGTDVVILAANSTTAGVLTAETQTIAGAKTFSDIFTATSNAAFSSTTLFVDSVNSRVGVGTTTPASPFHLSSPNIGSLPDTLRVTHTNDGAVFGPTLLLHRDSASPAASDAIGAISFRGNNSNAGEAGYSYIQSYISDPTAAAENGILSLAVMKAGTQVEVLKVKPNGIEVIGAIIEDIFTVTDGASVDLSPANGTIQQWTLGASRTPVSPTNWPAGSSMTLMINNGTAYTITWTTMGVTWIGNSSGGGIAPTLGTTGWTVITLWKVGTTIYGSLVGYSA